MRRLQYCTVIQVPVLYTTIVLRTKSKIGSAACVCLVNARLRVRYSITCPSRLLHFQLLLVSTTVVVILYFSYSPVPVNCKKWSHQSSSLTSSFIFYGTVQYIQYFPLVQHQDRPTSFPFSHRSDYSHFLTFSFQRMREIQDFEEREGLASNKTTSKLLYPKEKNHHAR